MFARTEAEIIAEIEARIVEELQFRATAYLSHNMIEHGEAYSEAADIVQSGAYRKQETENGCG